WFPLCPTQLPTPSPYTTLFRSDSRTPVGSIGRARRNFFFHLPGPGVSDLGACRIHGLPELRHVRSRLHFNPQVCLGAFVEVVLRDRKSTRLNSSHQIISYAVFC